MTIVVGVDNSDGSRAALRWALSYARVTGAPVQAITAWQDPSMYGDHGTVPDPYGPGGIAATAEQALAKTVSDIVATLDHPAEVRTDSIHVAGGPRAGRRRLCDRSSAWRPERLRVRAVGHRCPRRRPPRPSRSQPTAQSVRRAWRWSPRRDRRWRHGR